MEEIKKDAEKDVKELQSNIERIYPGTVERIYPGTVERIYPGTVERIYPGAVRAVLFDMDCSRFLSRIPVTLVAGGMRTLLNILPLLILFKHKYL